MNTKTKVGAAILSVSTIFGGSWYLRQAPVFQHLYTNGKAFVEDGGERRHVFCGASDFKLFARYAAGEDVAPVIEQRKETGANIVRVFLMYDGALGKFHPWEQDWPTSLRAFIPYVNERGLRIEFVVFADAQTAMPDHNLQLQWWRDVTTTLSDYANGVIVELVNEWPQNGIDPTRFQRPPPEWRLLASRGSSLGDAPPWGAYGSPYFAPWDYDTFHPRRDYPKDLFLEDGWWIADGRLGDGPRVGSPHPLIFDEPIGFAEEAQPGRRANDTYSAQAIALACRAYGAGCTFHSDQGINSELWTGRTLTAAQSFFRACTAFIGEDY